MREVVTSSREGGASLNILSGLVAGNFSAYWLGLAILFLMGIALLSSATSFPVAIDGSRLQCSLSVLSHSDFSEWDR